MKRRQEAAPVCDSCEGNRQLLQQLLAEVRELKLAPLPLPMIEPMRIDVAAIEPGDVLVLSSERHLHADELDAIERSLHGQFPHVQVMILDGGLQVRVVRPIGDAS